MFYRTRDPRVALQAFEPQQQQSKTNEFIGYKRPVKRNLGNGLHVELCGSERLAGFVALCTTVGPELRALLAFWPVVTDLPLLQASKGKSVCTIVSMRVGTPSAILGSGSACATVPIRVPHASSLQLGCVTKMQLPSCKCSNSRPR